VANQQAVADHRSEGPGGNETITITSASSPPLRAGTYYISLALFTTGVTASGNVTATVTTAAPPPPPAGGPTALTSGVAQNFTIGPVTTPTLFRSANGYTINVPQGATRLEIRVVTTTPNVDIDLFARFGVDPEVANQQVVADHRSEGAGGNETITLTLASSPPLRAGTYYISLALFTTGVTASGNVTATVTTAAPPPPSGSRGLVSGVPQNFSIGPVSNGTLFFGPNSYTIAVPQGATRLEIRLVTTTPNVDIDLYTRFGADPEVVNQQVAADHRSEGPTGDETIVVTPSSSPGLRAGTYYVSLALFTTGVTASGTLTATVSTSSAPPPSSGGPVALSSGVAQNFSIGPVASARLFRGADSYTIEVPQGATRLEIKLVTTPPDADVDLFARYGADTAISAGDVVADHRSTGPAGDETILITPTSSPALRPGTYYISLALYTKDVRVSGTLTATLATAAPPPPSGGSPVLTSGTPASFTLPAVTTPTLFYGNRSFVVDVPEGATRLDIQLMTTTPGADVDLFARFGADNDVSGGDVMTDHSSAGPTGSERITISASSSPRLRAGRYYISLAVYTTGVPVTGSVTAIVTTGAPPPPPPQAGATALISGQAASFSLPAVDVPTLFIGDYSYKISVPEGATKLQIQLSSAIPSIDADLYVRYERDADLGPDGVIADWGSEGETGNERIIITPSSNPTLRPGTYYIALILYSTGVASAGTVTATVERGSMAPPVSATRPLAPGAATPYSLPSVSQPTFFSGEYGYRVVVPPNAGKLEIVLWTEASNADVDLFVRYGAEPELVDGRIVADYRSASSTGNEYVTAHPLTAPPLRPGVYFIAFALYSTGVPARGAILAAITGTASSLAASEIGGMEKHGDSSGRPLPPKPGAPVAIPLSSAAKEEYGEPVELRKQSDGIRKPKSAPRKIYR
jgi:hypothetical protein